MFEEYHLTVLESDENQRLDKYLTHSLDQLSRTRLQNLIDEGHVQINGHVVQSASHKVKANGQITVHVPPAVDATPMPQEIPLEIIYEDEDVLVINKQAGLIVHPAPGHADETLVNALLAHCGASLSGIGGVKRPGIVHRLDKETTGLMVIAKNDAAHQGLCAQFEGRSLSRTYQAIVWGLPHPTQGTIDLPIGRCPKHRQKMRVLNTGKQAITHYKVLKTAPHTVLPACRLTLVECTLETGRTHQIRVHLNHIGHPLVGDPLYGHAPRTAAKVWPKTVLSFPRQALHALKLKFIHPRTHQEMTFECPLPDDLREILGMIR